ncbi:hypothetical protein LXT21_17200 [Myxococcus sp. K38C18041901]|uniref:hypothetical protein n=1 Tax=Myxococcus guangdongensis TaxID=2906760 RepID=UPI0020A8023F|nr:hypothetical protein [Myxococcus guangdongensis]MCP3060521.1 hypothetical protein [Myxococcus guangdongensis]
MNLWIALAAGLSVAQGQSQTPYPSPMDPNVRDPAAEALRDANEQAAEEADGAWIPPNYVIQQPTNDGTTPYSGGYVITPALPDGSAPATPSEIAIDETYQRYVPIPAQGQEAVGGSGAEENSGSTVSDTDLGVGGSGAVGDEGGDARVNQPGGSNTSALPQPTPAPLGGQDSTGGSGDYGTSAPQGSDSGDQVDGTGGSGTTPQTSVPNDQSGIGGSGSTPQTSVPNDQSGTGGSDTTPQTSVPNDSSGVGTSTTPQTSIPNDSSGVGTGTTAQPSTQSGTGGSGAQPQDSLGGFGPTEAEQGGGQDSTGTAPVSPNGTGGSGSNTAPQSTDTQGTSVPQNNSGTNNNTSQSASGQQQTSATTNPPASTDTEVAQLRARLDELEEELKTRDAEIEQNAIATQQQVDTFGERAVETEQSRQQRLSALQSAGEWMLAADAAIQQGEDDVDDALDIADSAFAEIRESAASFGQGNVIVHADRARALLNLARDAAGRSDGYAARLALQEAGVELNLARGASLGRSGTGNSLLSP